MTDSNTKPREAVIVAPGEGERLEAFGDTIEVKLSGAQTGGALAAGLASTPPGGGPPLHRHGREDELFLTVEGRFRFWVDGAWREAEPGSAVFLPRGVVHTFQNAGDTPARAWILTTPSGFESFFGQCAAEFARGGEPDMGRLVGICEAHGIEILGPPPAQAPP